MKKSQCLPEAILLVFLHVIVLAACAGSATPLSDKSTQPTSLARQSVAGTPADPPADEKAGLLRAAEASLAAKEYPAYVEAYRKANRRILVDERFGDNSKGWNLRSNKDVTAEISRGKLLVRKISDDSSSYFWIPVGIPQSGDFRIEARIEKKSGTDDRDVSLVWGAKDSDNNHQAGIEGSGKAVCGFYDDGGWISKFQRENIAAIRKGNAVNILAAERRGNSIEFFVNGNSVGTFSYTKPYGDKVGFVFRPRGEFEVEYFRVESLPSATIPWRTVCERAQADSDPATEVTYRGLLGDAAGLTSLAKRGLDAGKPDIALKAIEAIGLDERSARIRLASLKAERGDRASAASDLAENGWKVGDGLAFPLIDESFTDNSRNWPLSDGDTNRAAINKGNLALERRSDSGGYCEWITTRLARDADFSVEVSFKRLSGSDNSSFSINAGFDETGEMDGFNIFGAGKFSYGHYEKGNWVSVIDETESGLVNRGNAENIASITRIGDRLFLGLNGCKVAEAPFRGLRGGGIGMTVYKTIKVSVTRVKVTEYAPVFAIDLARDLVGQAGTHSKRIAALHMEQGLYSAALGEFEALGDKAAIQRCCANLGREAELAGDKVAAYDYYERAGEAKKHSALVLAAAAGASAKSDWTKAVRLYAAADESRASLEGLIAAQAALGRNDEVDAARARLAAWFGAKGQPAEELAAYRQIKSKAILAKAGKRYSDAGNWTVAVEMYAAAGDSAMEKDCYRRIADSQASSGDFGLAAESYAKAGLSAKSEAMKKKLKDSMRLPVAGAPSLFYKNDNVIISLNSSPSGDLFAVTDSGEFRAVTGPKASRTLASGIRASWSWPSLASDRAGNFIVSSRDEQKKAVLQRISADGARTTILTSEDEILAVAEDAGRAVYYSTMRTDGKNLTVTMNPSNHLEAAEFICGEIWKLDSSGKRDRIYEGGLPLALCVDSSGRLFAAIWGSKGAFRPPKGEYSVADPRHRFFVFMAKTVRVCAIGADGEATVLSDGLDAVSSLVRPGAGPLLCYGISRENGMPGFFAVAVSGGKKPQPYLSGESYSAVTAVLLRPGALYFADVEGKLRKVPLSEEN